MTSDASNAPDQSADDSGGRSQADLLVQRLIDGDLAPDEEADALRTIADDADARSVLRFELNWSSEASRGTRSEPPHAFADNVMQAIDASASRDDEPARSTSRQRLRDWLQPLTAPLTVHVRPVMAMLCLAGALWVGHMAGVGIIMDRSGEDVAGETSPEMTDAPAAISSEEAQTASISDEGAAVWMRFVYTASDAETVSVAGDFSQWEPIPLSPRTVRGETIWTGLVPVERGEHEYQFVIDGEQWVTDPLAPMQREDGFGARNAVLKL